MTAFFYLSPKNSCYHSPYCLEQGKNVEYFILKQVTDYSAHKGGALHQCLLRRPEPFGFAPALQSCFEPIGSMALPSQTMEPCYEVCSMGDREDSFAVMSKALPLHKRIRASAQSGVSRACTRSKASPVSEGDDGAFALFSDCPTTQLRAAVTVG